MSQQIPLNASSRIMYETAQKMGIECTLFGDKQTILMKKGERQWYTRGSRTSIQSSVGKTIADKKQLTKRVLQHFMVPTAKGVVINSVGDLQQVQDQNFSFPVVLKPLEERHGKGVLVGIQSLSELETILRNYHLPALVEETLVGTEYRIVCVNYAFFAASYRIPAHVEGDGVQTVTQLIEEKNRHPWRGTGHEQFLTKIEVDNAAKEYLHTQGFELDTVPALGQKVWIKKVANLSAGGEAWDVTDDVCEENRTLFAQIAKACDLNIAGIDVMCTSLAQPLTSQLHAGVIEVNASPGLRMHHYPMKGSPRDVAGAILSLMTRTL